jgi:hypothetical protein
MVGPMPPDTLNPKYPPRTEHRPAIAVLDVTIFNPNSRPDGRIAHARVDALVAGLSP